MDAKLVLLTGFLGAGKTTFLNHILHEFEDSKVGLIVNEFSETGVDGELIRNDIPGAQMVELNNGSIFCACIKDSFVDSLVELGSRDLEYVFVEASGLADPSSISSTLEQVARFRQVNYEYLGAICLCDALQFPKHSKVLISLQRQVTYSRAVVLNKTDLVDTEGLKKCEEAIRAIRSDIPIYPTTFGRVALRDILKEENTVTAEAQESTNTESTRPVTITMRTTEAISPEELTAFVNELTPFTYRIKGFCRTTEGTREVSAVGPVSRSSDWPINVTETQLVIISSVGIGIVSKTLTAAGKYYKEPVQLDK